MHTYIHTDIHTYVHVCIHVYMYRVYHSYLCIYRLTHAHMSMHVHMCMSTYIHIYERSLIHTCIGFFSCYIPIGMYIQMHICTQIRTHIGICISTYAVMYLDVHRCHVCFQSSIFGLSRMYIYIYAYV